MEVYALTPEERPSSATSPLRAFKEVIVKTFGAEGEEMLNAFLDAIKKANQ